MSDVSFEDDVPFDEAFWACYAIAYDPGTAENHSYQELMTHVLSGVDVPRDGVLVDAGCGTLNYGIHFLRTREDVRVIGVDANPAMLKRSREKVDRIGVNGAPTAPERCVLRRVALGSEPWPEEAQSVQVILSVNVLYTLADPEAYLRDAWNALAPGGVLHIVNLARPDIQMIIDHEDRWVKGLDQSGEEYARWKSRRWARDVVKALNAEIALRGRQSRAAERRRETAERTGEADEMEDLQEKMAGPPIHVTTVLQLKRRVEEAGFVVEEAIDRVYAGTCCLVRARKA